MENKSFMFLKGVIQSLLIRRFKVEYFLHKNTTKSDIKRTLETKEKTCQDNTLKFDNYVIFSGILKLPFELTSTIKTLKDITLEFVHVDKSIKCIIQEEII